MTEAQRLRARGLRPRKALGQHFLRDRSVLRRIASLVAPAPDELVVEIGAGTGALTRELLGMGARVHAIERDGALCALLREELQGAAVVVEQADARQLDLRARAGTGRVRVAGNIPYGISSEIVLRLIEQRDALALAVLLLQAEFAARLVASPGGREYGSLSVRCQQHLDPRRAFQVLPGAFHPPPRVRSTVLVLTARAAPLAAVSDDAEMERIVRASFGRRRKTLRNALRSRPGLDEALFRARIDGGRRPETLSVAEFARLTDELCRSSPR